VVIDMPSYGRIGDIAEVLLESLRGRGAAAELADEALELAVAPTCIVVTDDTLRDEEKAASFSEYVTNGGGMVLLFGTSTRHVEQASAFLGPLGARIERVRGQSQRVRFIKHPMTEGLQSPTSAALRVNVTGDVWPLAFQGASVVSAWLQVDKGGITMVPVEMVESLSDERPGGAAITCLTRACLWGPEQMAETLTRPQPSAEATAQQAGRKQEKEPPPKVSLPEEATDFAGAVLVDSRATKDFWPKIGPHLLTELKHLGLPLKALAIGDDPAPLVRALESNPPLVVLGSWREFREAEMVALEHYLWGGGRILAAGAATRHFQIRLVYLNMFLGPLGCTITLGRPRGEVETAPELGNMAGVPPVPFGAQVRGEVTVLAEADGYIVAGALPYGRGTIVAMDISPLRQVPEYLQVVGACLRWLMEHEPVEH